MVAEKEREIQDLIATRQELEETNRDLQETSEMHVAGTATRDLREQQNGKEMERLRHEVHR